MEQDYVITIDQEVEIMVTKMKESSKLLQRSPARRSCCIFTVPQSLFVINREAYQPRVVSIGPYHHGNKELEMMEDHKWRFLNDMITRTGKPLGFFMNMIVSMENEIRESYSESIDRFGTSNLAKMMVLDGFFLIELFRKVGKLVPTHADDPIFKMGWISPYLVSDLLMIENQIPFLVLQKLFQESTPNNAPTLQSLILEFFSYISIDRKPEVLNRCKNLDGNHVLDIFRQSFIYTKKERNHVVPKHIPKILNHSLKLIRPATALVTAGVKFKPNYQADSFLDIEFQNGLLLIPQIGMDGLYGSFLMNCIAFEQCYFYSSKHITAYVVFIGCLIKTPTDVSLLSQNNTIENYFGKDKEIVNFFTDVNKVVTFDITSHYLLDLFEEINEYCKNGWNIGWAGFKRTYFESPWASISACAAFTLLSLAALQTFYTVFPYYYK